MTAKEERRPGGGTAFEVAAQAVSIVPDHTPTDPDRTPCCFACLRPITARTSVARGIGPVCAQHLAHGIEAAVGRRAVVVGIGDGLLLVALQAGGAA